jgi:hypothetical protein
MLPKRIIYVCVFLLMAVKPFAQVSLQTGSATFSLPVFEWKDDKSRLNSSVSIYYNSGNGLKVGDVASNLGQGWSLSGGGVITRLQVGEPDDQVAYNGNGTEQDIRKYPAGYLYAATPAYNGCPNALSKYPIYGSMNQVYTLHNSISEDKQLDYFSFQFNGKTGMFALDKVNGDYGVSLGDTKMKISFVRDPSLITMTNQGIRTTIKSFTIQDIDGLIYRFNQLSTTKVLQSNYCDAGLTQARTQPKFDGGGVYHQAGFDNAQYLNPYTIGSWYLSEVEDPLTHRKITFNYTVRTINNVAGEEISYNLERDFSIISHRTSVTKTPEVTSMVYPDGHVVAFGYGAARVDLNGEYAMSGIDVTYQGRPLSKFQLNTTYFILNRYGTPVSPFQKKMARLCLKSIKKIGVDLKEDTPPYVFDYYTGSNAADDFVPPPFSYAKDIWGFYNGSNSVGYDNAPIPLTGSISDLNNNQLKGLCFLHTGVSGVYLNSKPGYAKNGLLRQVIYPTGGTLSYQYDQNVGVLNGSTVSIGGVHVAQANSTDGGYSNGCANPLFTRYDYVMNGPGSASSLWGLEMPVNSVVTNNHYAAELKKYKWSFSCAPFGCCYWKFSYPGILSQNQSVSLTDFQRFMEAAAPVLGIISIVTTVMDVVNLVCYSSGVLAWVAVIIDIVGGLITLGITCFSGNHSSDKTNTIYYSSNLNEASPLPAQFKRVEIVENPGTIGKVVHEFTSEDDYPVWVPSNPTFSAKQRFAPWAYGLTKRIVYYDASGNKVKETENQYNFNNSQSLIDWIDPHYPGNPSGVRTNLLSCKCVVQKNYSQRNTDWGDPAQYNLPASYLLSSNSDITVDFYGFYTGRTQLNTSYERVFKPNDVNQYLETVTYYGYNYNNYLLSSISTVQSNGDGYGKSITYSNDLSGGVINTMLQNNMVAVPVATTTSMSYSAGGSAYLNETVTEFTQLSNGDIKPYRTLEQRFKKPLDPMVYDPGSGGWNWIWHGYQGPTDPAIPATYKVTQVKTYDASGNLTGTKDEGNHTIANIYDYNDKYVVATTVNADPVLDRPAYSSFETYAFGGWQLAGSGPVYISNSGVTGSRAFNLASNTFSATALNTAKPYIVSFWANNSNVVVTGGATLSKSAPTINGFTYYEYDIAQGNSSVSVSGNAYIDELRIHPRMSRMSTVTYDPLIGKTSECDENSRITYYEYDNLGRLRFIKDENRNIAKMYEYNTVAKQNGCPGTYYSKLTTETFTHSNCGAGYVGGSITYTVPANKYTSTISQEDADAQVDNELFTSGQTYANTNGACILLYYNTVQSLTITSQNCPAGYKGGNVTYTVPAGRYSTTVSQAAANQQALDEIAANAQAWANNPANSVCVVDTDPDWEWDNVNAYCQSINGQLPAHQFVKETDVNPNSASYNQTRWTDVGPQDACPPGNYYNIARSQVFNKNDCSGGSAVTYNVAPGIYSSTVSQAAADQLATNDINANGQAYANAHGTCCLPSFTYTSGLSSVLNYLTLSGSTATFTWVFGYPGYSSVQIGTITSACCRPTSTRVIPVNIGSSVFNVTITQYGDVSAQLMSGPVPTGTVGFQGVFNLYANSYYSVAKSGYFTRNNCPAGQVGTGVTYNVQAYRYYSITSQADADQLAQNEVNNNGQNYANTNGTCNVSCSFAWASGLSGYTANISSSGSNSTFQLVFPSPSSSYYGGTIGTINGGCRPSSTRYLTVTDGATSSRTWSVTINTNGTVQINLGSGSPATNSGPPIVLNGSFPL